VQVSIVNFSNLEPVIKRLDSQYYQNKYIIADSQIEENQWESLENLSSSIKSFGAYALCNLFGYVDEGIPFLRCQDVFDGYVDFSNCLKIDEFANKLLHKSEIYSGSILLTMSGTVGNAAIADENWDYPINSNQDIAKIVTNGEIDPYYLTVFLNSKFGKLQTERLPIGSIQQHIFLWQLANLKIPIFSNDFSVLISNIYKSSLTNLNFSASIYSEVENIIINELDLINWNPSHQLGFTKNFSDTQTSERFDAEYFQPKYDDLLKHIKKYSGGFDTLENLVNIKKCIEPGSSAYQENGIPFIRVSNLSKSEISYSDPKYISENLYSELITHQPKQGEILLSKDATPGIAYYLDKKPIKMIPSSGILRLTVKDEEKIKPEYLTLVLNSILVQQQMLRDAGGSIIVHWRPDQIKATLIPILDDDKQIEIQVKLQESFDCRAKSKALIEIAKRGVEMVIEQDETTAENWINEEVAKLGVELND